MKLPGYAADASLYASGRIYQQTLTRVSTAVRPLMVSQAGCEIGGAGTGGGGRPPTPRRCAPNQRCCEPAAGGLCFLCVPRNFQCP